MTTDEEIKEHVIKIYCFLQQNTSVMKCDDTQCDNEDCVLFRAVRQYLEHTY